MITEGRILAIQEQRFRLVTDLGQVYLLTLAHDATCDASQLHRLQLQRARIQVEFSGQPNLAGGVAHQVREAV